MAEKEGKRILHVQVPAKLAVPLERAADREMVSVSSYVRWALAGRLERDGYLPKQEVVA